MTEEEIRKKAEEFAKTQVPSEKTVIVNGKYEPNSDFELGILKGYEQCYRDMTSGPAQGWGIKYDGELRSDTVGEYQFSSGYGNEVVLCFTDRTDAMDYIATILPTSAKIEIVPVKLIEVKEK